MILRFRKPRSEVTLPVAEWHATTLAIDGLVDHNDDLQHKNQDLLSDIGRLGTVILGEFDGETRTNESAIDCAIRILREQAARIDRLVADRDSALVQDGEHMADLSITITIQAEKITTLTNQRDVARLNWQKCEVDRALLVKQVEELTEQRDRARRWAVALEQDNADLERANTELKARIETLNNRLHWHHRGMAFLDLCQGCDQQRATDPEDVHGVPA